VNVRFLLVALLVCLAFPPAAQDVTHYEKVPAFVRMPASDWTAIKFVVVR
jgi:hypothetical protein